MQKTIYYWDSIIGQEALVAEYKTQIQRLLSGEYKGVTLDLKKLKGSRIYSIRLNSSDRLLFTTLTSNDGKSYLVLLEKISNHDYQKSRFLRPGVLKRFLEQQGADILNNISESHFEDLDHLPTSGKCEEEPELLKVEYYRDTFILLNKEQTQAAECYKSLPLILSGPPGSGKSCVALTILSQCVDQHVASNKPILLITRHEHLKANLQAIFSDMNPDVDPKCVQFRTYNELLAELTQTHPNQFLGKNDFKLWLKGYSGKRPFPGTLPPTDAIYNEFAIINVYDESYLQLGALESIFTNPDERNWLLQAYQDYRKHLGNNINPDFQEIKQESAYACIVADESQNFSPRQLRVLIALANSQVCFCLDTNQAIEDVQSKRAFLTKEFHKLGISVHDQQLPVAYRCSREVTQAVNALLSIKYRLAGGKIDKHQYGLIELAGTQARQGSVQWWNPDDIKDENNHLLQQAANSVEFAVVTLPEFVSEVRQLINTPLIFSSGDHVAGLEYKTIFAYRLFDANHFIEINRKLREAGPALSKESIHRQKNKGMSTMLDNPHLSQAFIAFSRACDNLIICQRMRYELEEILKPIKEAVSQDPSKTMISTAKASEADWEQQRQLQLAVGNKQQAKLIDDIFLGKTQETTKDIQQTDPLVMSSSSSSSPQSATKSPTSKPLTGVKTKEKKSFEKDATDKKSRTIKQEPFATTTSSAERFARELVTNAQDFYGHMCEALQRKDADKILFEIEIENENVFEHIAKSLKWNPFVSILIAHLLSLKSNKISPLYNVLQNENLKQRLNKGYKDKGKIFLRAVSLQKNAKSKDEHRLALSYLAVCSRLLKSRYMENVTYRDLEELVDAVITTKVSSWLVNSDLSSINVSNLTPYGNTLLHEAAEIGDTKVAIILCRYHSIIDEPNASGRTALYLATMAGHLDIVNILLARGAYPYNPQFQHQPLIKAIEELNERQNGMQIFTALFNARIMRICKPGIDVLFATAASDSDLITLVTDAIDCKLLRHDKRNALFPAAENGITENIHVLTGQGCDPEQIDINGCTPLAAAISKSQLEAVKILFHYLPKSCVDRPLRLTREGLYELGDRNRRHKLPAPQSMVINGQMVTVNRHNQEQCKDIASRYQKDGVICISPVDLAKELGEHEIVRYLTRAVHSYVRPGGFSFFQNSEQAKLNSERIAKEDADCEKPAPKSKTPHS